MKMKNKKVIAIAVVIVVIIVAIIVGVAVKVSHKQPEQPVISEELSEVQVEDEPQLPEIPVDFATLQAQYPDIYAWLDIPGTDISYAVVQAPEGEDDDYYLRKNLDGEKETAGTLYTQRSLNAQDFSDNVTIIYGHNMRNNTMFGTLDMYANEDHRNECHTILIYTPGKIYTYELAFAVTFGDEHIIYNYDCNYDAEGYQEFLDALKNSEYEPTWFNEEIELTTEDKILVLSTCNSVDDQRYLIGAKLISIEDGEYAGETAADGTDSIEGEVLEGTIE